jgi:hypothetical protein
MQHPRVDESVVRRGDAPESAFGFLSRRAECPTSVDAGITTVLFAAGIQWSR